MMIDLQEVGAFPSLDQSNNLNVRFGLYLPCIRASDGFEVVVRIIHRDDRFDLDILPKDFSISWQAGHPLDLWTAAVPIEIDAASHA